MGAMNRLDFLKLAASIGALLALGAQHATRSATRWIERRDRFARFMASGDPDTDSVFLWTCVPE